MLGRDAPEGGSGGRLRREAPEGGSEAGKASRCVRLKPNRWSRVENGSGDR